MGKGDPVVRTDDAWCLGHAEEAQRLAVALGPDSVVRIVILGARRVGKPLDLPLTIGERSHA